ncbi:MAG: lactate racemase domain-containing protein [Planctomycetaceae bacterium]
MKNEIHVARFPRMCDIRQRFDSPQVDDIAATVHSELQKLNLPASIKPGDTVAITAGSRGVANIALILRSAVDCLKQAGAVPFLVPAMGSHGGGTVDGQLEVLRGLGVTEDTVGAPIRATMETVIVAQSSIGLPVHFDRYASQADHVLVVGRIKPHTRFVGAIESGLHKMMLIGLGKHEGAKIYHRGIMTHSFPEIIQSVGRKVLQDCRVIGGLAIIENARDETALIEAVKPDAFESREPELLKMACRWLPILPFPKCDVLIVDRIGKNISGVGLDSNVVGRKYLDHMATENDIASCRRIVVRGLTEETHGNGTGIGMTEFTTQKCVDQIDHVKTRINCITGLHPEAAMIPITLPTDADAVEAALQTIGLIEPEAARVIQISDTLHLTRVRVSEAYFPEVRERDDLDFIGEPFDFPVDPHGCLRDVEA